MSDESSNRPAADDGAVTTAARLRYLIGRLLGPWLWTLAAFGAACLLAPATRYVFPTPGFDRPPPSSYEYFHGEPPTVGITAGPVFRNDLIAAGHWREVAITVNGIPREVRARGSEEIRRFLTADDAPARLRAYPRWGTSLVSDVERPIIDSDAESITVHAKEYRTATLRLGLVWLAGVPALWTAWRMAAAWRHGWGASTPPGWLRRAARPFAITFGVFGAGLIAFGGGENHNGPRWGETTVSALARRDPKNAFHPRFVRLVVDQPLADVPDLEEWDGVEPRPPWAFGDRRLGIQADRRIGSRFFVYRLMFDPDDPSFEERTAVNISLWYVLLPAALWSGVSLCRSRGGRMRPA